MNLLELLREMLREHIDIPAESIVPEAALVDIGVDSLTLAELLFDLEDKHGISVELPENATPPRTIGELIALIEPLVKQAQA